MRAVIVAGSGNSSFLKDTLEASGFAVMLSSAEKLLRDLMTLNDVSLILVHSIPGESSVPSICKQVRDLHDTPLVVFGHGLSERDIVPTLEAGADDILTLPMRPVEAMARLRAVLRRLNVKPTGDAGPLLVAGDITVSLKDHQAFRSGRRLSLSPLELKLLTLLVRDSGRPLSHSKLISHVWGPEYADCRHYLRLYIRYLREKIEDDPRSPLIILNEWGTGYRLEPVEATPAA